MAKNNPFKFIKKNLANLKSKAPNTFKYLSEKVNKIKSTNILNKKPIITNKPKTNTSPKITKNISRKEIIKNKSYFYKPIITGYGKTTGYSHKFHMNPANVDLNLDTSPDPVKEPITKLPKGGKKTLLVTGAKNFNFTEVHERQLVRNFKKFEKEYGSAQIAHDYNPKNKTSAFVARVAKKYNLPIMEERTIHHESYNPDPKKNEGFKNREISRQKGVDAGKVFRVSYSQKGKLSAVAPDRLERDNWKNRLKEIKTESRFRSKTFSKKGKNTQAYKPINALMDEIMDHPYGSKKREAGLGYLREYNEDLRTRLNRSSADVTDFLYRQEEGTLPKGAKIRFEIDDTIDIDADPRPKRKVVVHKGKPRFFKQDDVATFENKGFIEKFEDAYDDGTVSDNVRDKKKFTPADKTLLTGSKKQNIQLATKKSGPDAYGQSSLTQFLMSNEEEPEHREAKRKSLQDVKSIDIEAEPSDKGGGGNIQRHQVTYGEKQQDLLAEDIEDINKQKATFKSIERKNKKLKKQKKPLITGKSLMTSQRDPLKWDRQSKTLEHISDVDMPKETKAQKDAKVLEKVKEGAYGGKAKHGKMKYRIPVRSVTAPLKAVIPFVLGGGALQTLTNEAFGERAASNMERANRRGGGGKKPFHLRKREIPLTKLSTKKYRKYA